MIIFQDVTKKTMLTREEYVFLIGFFLGTLGSFIAGCLVQAIFGGKKTPGA